MTHPFISQNAMIKLAPQVGVGVLVINPAGELLLGQRKGSHGALSWAPAGGHLEYGETFEACAQRELFEETGCVFETFSHIGVTNDVFAQDHKHYISIFLKTFCPFPEKISCREPEKIIAWQWFPLEKLPAPLFLPLNNLLKHHGLAWLRAALHGNC